MKKIRLLSLLLLVSFVPSILRAQNDHAVEGSPYAGSLGTANNPASILSAPYPWDITLFSFQLTNATNLVTISDLSLIHFSDSSKYEYNGGDRSRYVNFNFNLHLLNARIALNPRQAIAFGANLRGYGIGRTSNYNFNDTLHNLSNFFSINNGTPSYSANLVSSTWVELFATYSQTLKDDETSRLNAGMTVRVMRGVSGAIFQLAGGSVQNGVAGGQPIYTLNHGSARYGYSSNYDTWQKGRSVGQNLNQFLVDSRAGAAVDLGVEYYVKTQAIKSSGQDDYYDYEWKIGVSLLDIGENRYKYGDESRLISNPKGGLADSVLQRKFGANFSNLGQINDSLHSIVGSFQNLSGLFNIRNPARLVINVDRPLGDQFYINGNVSVNLTSGSNGGKTWSVQEMNLLTVTPRWENQRWGAYLPIQYTTEGRLMIGGAFKAGPLLFGIHNWGNVFSTDKMQNGGGYIALVLRPGHGFRVREDKQYTCPKPIY